MSIYWNTYLHCLEKKLDYFTKIANLACVNFGMGCKATSLGETFLARLTLELTNLDQKEV